MRKIHIWIPGMCTNNKYHNSSCFELQTELCKILSMVFSLNVFWTIRHVTWSQSLISRILNYWNLVIKNCCSELKSVKNDRKIEYQFFFLIINVSLGNKMKICFNFMLFGGQVSPMTRSHHLLNKPHSAMWSAMTFISLYFSMS